MRELDLTDLQKVDLSKYPDVHKLPDVLHRSLWVLAVCKNELGTAYLSAHHIAKALTEVCEISVTAQGVSWSLERAGAVVHRKTVRGSKTYAIMQKGREAILALAHEAVFVVDPERAYTSLVRFQKVLTALKGNVSICDPYIDGRTLEIIKNIPAKCSIRFLSVHVQKQRQFRELYRAYQREYGNLEIRLYQRGELHDRYIISQEKMLLVGQSLNGIGKKETFVVELGEDMRQQMADNFEKRWNSSKVFS